MPQTFPFSAIVGQDQMNLGLVLNAINPSIGGILIRGEKGTAKSTAVRAIADLLSDIDVVQGCLFSCNPHLPVNYCPECLKRSADGELPYVNRRRKVVELPINATEDRVSGTLDLERALTKGEKRFEPGLLAKANRGILYVDEVNLLDDHIVDILLDSAAMGVNVVEREGVSYSHPAEFVLVGTMNPEEGELRPQLIDRFGLCTPITGITDPDLRVEVIRRRSAFEADPETFYKEWEPQEKNLSEKISEAQKLLNRVEASDHILNKISKIAVNIGVDGHRADITMLKAAKTIAAFHGRTSVTDDDVLAGAELSLYHRIRRKPFEEIQLDMDLVKASLRA
ncbi:MAG: AAA domain-containing protein [Desulfobacteraceae bacterium]|nr:ATP-binding protein [Desulfobacteraceae bacterium]MBC2757455.1 AAA domain-containing protein [Desulfobacteraceae bacterium]